MKNSLIYIFILLFLSAEIIAQDVFVKHYGDFSGQGSSVIIDSQGNFLLAGNRYYSQKYEQFCVNKIDQNGNLIWEKNYGDITDDFACKIIHTIDDGYALIGYSSTNYTASCITFMKIQNTGDLSWSKSIGGSALERAMAIVQTSNGEYFIGGKKDNPGSMSDFYLVKTDINGDTLWTKSYGGNGNEIVHSIVLCSDGGIVMAGSTDSYGAGSSDFYLVKVSSSGNVQWAKTYGDSLIDVPNSVKQTPDGGYIIVGYSHYTATSGDIFIVKTNSVGDTLWSRTFSSAGKGLTANDVVVTQDGGYALTGTVDIWQTIPNGISYVRGDARIMKLFNNGQIQAIKEYSVGPSNSCLTSGIGNSIIQLPDESCVIGGTFFNCSTFEMLLIKTFDVGPLAVKEYEKLNGKIFPNPSAGEFAIESTIDSEIEIYDLFGTLVFSSRNRTGKIRAELNQKGVFFVKVTTIERSETLKLLIE